MAFRGVEQGKLGKHFQQVADWVGRAVRSVVGGVVGCAVRGVVGRGLVGEMWYGRILRLGRIRMTFRGV